MTYKDFKESVERNGLYDVIAIGDFTISELRDIMLEMLWVMDCDTLSDVTNKLIESLAEEWED